MLNGPTLFEVSSEEFALLFVSGVMLILFLFISALGWILSKIGGRHAR